MIDYIVITPFFPSKGSFRGSYLLDQAKAIQSNSNHKLTVIILSSFFKKSDENYTFEGVNCITFQLLDLPSFIFPGIFHSINLSRFNVFLKKNGLTPNDKSIIHGHINYPSLNFLEFFSKKYKCKTILQHHGLDILQTQTGLRLPFLKNIQNKIILKRFKSFSTYISTHIAVSSVVKSELIKIVPKLKNRLYVCANGVDTSKFYVDSLKKTKNSKFIIGCVANFWELKDHITLLKAVKILNDEGVKNIHLKLVGNGETFKQCFEYAKNNNIDCEFVDEIKHSELRTYYNQLDLFVLPSKYEAFGCVYLEALACGVPFIGVKNQGIEDVVPDGLKDFQLVEKNSPSDLSKLISYFYSNKLTIKFDEKYNIDNTIRQMLNHVNNQ